MKRKRQCKSVPVFGDKDFLFGEFGDFPLDLKICVLKFLKIREIVKFRHIINDEEINSLDLRQFKNNPDNHDDYLDGRLNFEEFKVDSGYYNPRTSKQDRFDYAVERLEEGLEMIRNNDISIPIHIEIGSRDSGYLQNNHFKKLRCLDCKPLDIRLSLTDLRCKDCKLLNKFSSPKKVNELIVTLMNHNEYKAFEIDISKFTELKKFDISEINDDLEIQIKLDYSNNLYHNLTELITYDIFDLREIGKFTNLKTLKLTFKHGKDVFLPFLPRSITKLKLTSLWGTGVLHIKSNADCPPNLTYLKLYDDEKPYSPWRDTLAYSFPSTLKTLKIYGEAICSVVTMLPPYLTCLELRFARSYSLTQDYDFELPATLEKLQLQNLNITIRGSNNMVLPKRLVECDIGSCNFSFELYRDNLDGSNKYLKYLSVSNDHDDDDVDGIPLNNLNFKQFSKLTSMDLFYCGISSLTDFRPPLRLEYLKINDNKLSSMDETCPLFNNPNDYPNLTMLDFCCQITYISPNIKLPVNLESLQIRDDCSKQFCFNTSIVTHQKLTHVCIRQLSSVSFNVEHIGSEMNTILRELSLDFDENSFPGGKDEIDQFYDKLERVLWQDKE
ncbi:hypothetical protein DFJ63DRAFT_313826 [Scheffersomyces coipomensis]|uniref:uncharacterized protein n=1 Tax=Scheffersomyces coipomensis TaxID=1788519 RepID=UPI00315D77CB